MRKNKKKKTIQYSKMVSLQLEAEDILEFLDFLKVAENNDIRCASASKIKKQLHELVISRIECREPKVIIHDYDDIVQIFDEKKMQKLAFNKTGLDELTVIKKYNFPSGKEIIETMDAPLAEKVTTAGELNAIAREEQRKNDFMNEVQAEWARRASENKEEDPDADKKYEWKKEMP